jgi:hypothetical protein
VSWEYSLDSTPYWLFTAVGHMEPNSDPEDVDALKKLLAPKLILDANVPEGMGEDGSMESTLARTLGGHGRSF